MRIRARMSMSADGYVSTPTGWPALTADPAFVSGQSYGIPPPRRDDSVGRHGSVELVYGISRT
jgi:hypothetical protein